MPTEVKKDFFDELQKVPEVGVETGLDQASDARSVLPPIEKPGSVLPTSWPEAGTVATAVDPILSEVEVALAEGLENIYKNLPADKKMEFKQTGEATARSITQLIRSAKFKMSQVLELILGWLKLIPGVNKLFLKQEAKIRADRVLEIVKEEHPT